jgi:hypothetical protein
VRNLLRALGCKFIEPINELGIASTLLDQNVPSTPGALVETSTTLRSYFSAGSRMVLTVLFGDPRGPLMGAIGGPFCNQAIKFDICKALGILRDHETERYGSPRVRLNVMQPSQVGHCRQKAAECEEEAKRCPSSSLAAAWLGLAEHWHEMADRIERNNSLSAGVPLWRRLLALGDH